MGLKLAWCGPPINGQISTCSHCKGNRPSELFSSRNDKRISDQAIKERTTFNGDTWSERTAHLTKRCDQKPREVHLDVHKTWKTWIWSNLPWEFKATTRNGLCHERVMGEDVQRLHESNWHMATEAAVRDVQRMGDGSWRQSNWYS